jgi:broad specificity phosphatase PhoE
MNNADYEARLASLEKSFIDAAEDPEIKVSWLKTRAQTIAKIAKRAASEAIDSGERFDLATMNRMADSFAEQMSAITAKYIRDEETRFQLMTAFASLPPMTHPQESQDSVLARVRSVVDRLAGEETEDDDREVLLVQLSESLSVSLDQIAKLRAESVPASAVAVVKAELIRQLQDLTDPYLDDEARLMLDYELSGL